MRKECKYFMFFSSSSSLVVFSKLKIMINKIYDWRRVEIDKDKHG